MTIGLPPLKNHHHPGQTQNRQEQKHNEKCPPKKTRNISNEEALFISNLFILFVPRDPIQSAMPSIRTLQVKTKRENEAQEDGHEAHAQRRGVARGRHHRRAATDGLARGRR